MFLFIKKKSEYYREVKAANKNQGDTMQRTDLYDKTELNNGSYIM